MTSFRSCVVAGKRLLSMVGGTSIGHEANLYQHMFCLTTTSSTKATGTSIRYYSNTIVMNAKPGTPMQGLDVFHDKDIPVVLERDEYPEWVFKLPAPLLTFAQLRRLPNDDATLPDIHRFLRLKRRLKIKDNNERSKN